jgi:hypothetical protein
MVVTCLDVCIIYKKVEKSVRQTKQSITKSIEENDKDATILLSMGKS